MPEEEENADAKGSSLASLSVEGSVFVRFLAGRVSRSSVGLG